MDIKLIQGASGSVAEITLKRGESCISEVSAMISMSTGVELTTTLKRATIKRMLGGENLCINEYKSVKDNGKLWLSGGKGGQLCELILQENTVIARRSTFVASAASIHLDYSWQGLKNLVVSESPLWLSINGIGRLLLRGEGAVFSVEVHDNLFIDAGNLLAYTAPLKLKLQTSSKKLSSTLLNQEGLVYQCLGIGTVWLQSNYEGEQTDG